MPPPPTCHPGSFLSPTFLCVLRLLLLCLRQGPHLSPCFPPAPIWGRGLPWSSRGWNPMFTFSSVSAPTLCGALRNQKRTCCCTWACLLLDDGGQSKDWTGGGKQWSKRDLGVDCSSWLVLAGRYLLAFGPSFSPSSTALELRLLLCLGSVASIVTGLGPSTHDLQHPDLLPEVLVQLLEAGGGTECGYKATALWG